MLVDEMPAGREMDRIIGEKLFGYWVYHYDKDFAENCYCCLMDGSGDAVVDGLHDGERKTEEEAWGDCPEFSAEIAAAWEVVKKLKEKGWSFRYSNNACAEYQHAAAFYQCYKAVSEDILTGKSIYKDNAYAIANTACLATGRAALKAMGVNEI